MVSLYLRVTRTVKTITAEQLSEQFGDMEKAVFAQAQEMDWTAVAEYLNEFQLLKATMNYNCWSSIGHGE